MSPSPPRFLRVVWILARNSLRRRANRIASLTRKRKEGRSAVGRKSSTGGLLLVVFGGLMLFQSFMLSGQAVSRFAYSLDLRIENRPLSAGDMIRRRIGPGLAEPWPEAPETERALLVLAGLTLTALSLAILCTNLGAANQDLGRVQWSTEWLFGFPVGARSLFAARVLEYAVTDLFVWVTVFPFLTMLFWRAGRGFAGVGLALVSAFSVSVLLSGIRLATETWLRKRFPLHRVKNWQAVFTVTGLLLLFATFWIATVANPLPEALLGFAERVPGAGLLLPFALPAAGAVAPLAVVGMAGVAGLAAAAAVGFAARLVRDGLVSFAGSVQKGRRGRAGAGAGRGSFGGILGKELRLLVRDRNFFVQTLITPLLIVGFQAVANPTIFGNGGAGSSAVVAFGIGAYVLMFGAFSVLAVERESLWLVWTLPVHLGSLLRRKARLWAGVALLYTAGVLALSWRPGPSPSAATLAGPLAALAGVAVAAFLATGIAALGTDPFEDRPNRRIGARWVYLYMLLATALGWAVGTPSLWAKGVLLAIGALLAGAVWEKAEERLPLLLDPTLSPPRRVTWADGLVYVLLYFALQQAAAAGWAAIGVESAGGVLLLGVGTAGMITVLVAALRLPRGGVADVVSFGRSDAEPRASRVVITGTIAGLAAAGCGFLWLAAVDAVPFLRTAREQWGWGLGEADAGARIAYVLIALCVAPLVEEFLFRGFVFRGLSRSAPRLAVAGSAAIFALVHPPLSFPAVFAMGAAAALAFRRTGSLWAAVLAHAVYNSLVLVAS